MAKIQNKWINKDAEYFKDISDTLLVGQSLIIDSSEPELLGYRYQSYADCVAYINANGGASYYNRWACEVRGQLTEDIALEPFINVTSPNRSGTIIGDITTAGTSNDGEAYKVDGVITGSLDPIHPNNILEATNCVVDAQKNTVGAGTLYVRNCKIYKQSTLSSVDTSSLDAFEVTESTILYHQGDFSKLNIRTGSYVTFVASPTGTTLNLYDGTASIYLTDGQSLTLDSMYAYKGIFNGSGEGSGTNPKVIVKANVGYPSELIDCIIYGVDFECQTAGNILKVRGVSRGVNTGLSEEAFTETSGGVIEFKGDTFNSDILSSKDTVSAINEIVTSGYVRWRGAWSAGAYNTGEMVSDGAYLMIANKPTEERAAPQPTGSEFYTFDGVYGTDSVVGKQVIYGQRYSTAQGGFINGWRLQSVIGNNYRVFTIRDPLGAKIVTDILSFEAVETGEVEVNTDPILVGPGEVFDIVVMESEPDATPTTFAYNWNYTKPSNPEAPAVGFITHSSKNSDIISISKTADGGADATSDLASLTVGDKFYVGSSNWIIQAIVDNGTYFTFSIAPASQSSLSGVQTFTFETVTATPLNYGYLAGHWTGNPNTSGLFVVDDSYDNIAVNDNAYGLDLKVVEADVSLDWDIAASGNQSFTAGGNASKPLVKIVTASTTAEVNDLIVVSGDNGAITITLPSILANGDTVSVKANTSDILANPVTISGVGTIDGQATASLKSETQSLKLITDGTNWFLV